MKTFKPRSNLNELAVVLSTVQHGYGLIANYNKDRIKQKLKRKKLK